MSHAVASQFVRHDVPGLPTTTSYKPLEEALCRGAVSSSLKINIDHFAILIHSAPHVLLRAIDPHLYVIEVERIAVTAVSLFESTSVLGAKLDTPESDGFVPDIDASFGK